MSPRKYIFAALMLLVSVGFVNGVHCSYTTSRWLGTGKYVTYKYCSDSCCGRYGSQYCCTSFHSDNDALIGIIVGSVIGGILFISCVIAVVCCCVKKSSHRGQVVQPMPQQHTMVIYSDQGHQPSGYTQQQYRHPAPHEYQAPLSRSTPAAYTAFPS